MFVEPPPDGFPGMPPKSLLKVVKAVYGLGDAPRQWYNKIVSVLKDDLHMEQSSLDQCCFFKKTAGELNGILCIHVDDILTAGDVTFHTEVLQRLRKLFPFKHWKENSGNFLGRRLT